MDWTGGGDAVDGAGMLEVVGRRLQHLALSVGLNKTHPRARFPSAKSDRRTWYRCGVLTPPRVGGEIQRPMAFPLLDRAAAEDVNQHGGLTPRAAAEDVNQRGGLTPRAAAEDVNKRGRFTPRPEDVEGCGCQCERLISALKSGDSNTRAEDVEEGVGQPFTSGPKSVEFSMRAEEVEEGESRCLTNGPKSGEYSMGCVARMDACALFERLSHFIGHLHRGETDLERLKSQLNISDEVLREYHLPTNLQEFHQLKRQEESHYIDACFAFLKQTTNEVDDFELVDIVRWVVYGTTAAPRIHIHFKSVRKSNPESDHQLFCASVRLSNPLRQPCPECRVLGCILLQSKCHGDNSGILEKCLVCIPETSPCMDLTGDYQNIVEARNIQIEDSSVINDPPQQNQRCERASVSFLEGSSFKVIDIYKLSRLDEFVIHLIRGDTDLEHLKLKLHITDQILKKYLYPRNMDELNQNRWNFGKRYFDACFAYFKQITDQDDEFKFRDVRCFPPCSTKGGLHSHLHFEVLRKSNVELDHPSLEVFCAEVIDFGGDKFCVLGCVLLEPNCPG